MGIASNWFCTLHDSGCFGGTFRCVSCVLLELKTCLVSVSFTAVQLALMPAWEAI